MGFFGTGVLVGALVVLVVVLPSVAPSKYKMQIIAKHGDARYILKIISLLPHKKIEVRVTLKEIEIHNTR